MKEERPETFWKLKPRKSMNTMKLCSEMLLICMRMSACCKSSIVSCPVKKAIFQPKWKILAFSHDMTGQISWRQIKSESGHLGVLGLNFPSARSVISPVLGHSTHWSRGRGCQPLVRQKGSSAGTNTGIIGQHQPGSQKTSMQSLIFFSS